MSLWVNAFFGFETMNAPAYIFYSFPLYFSVHAEIDTKKYWIEFVWDSRTIRRKTNYKWFCFLCTQNCKVNKKFIFFLKLWTQFSFTQHHFTSCKIISISQRSRKIEIVLVAQINIYKWFEYITWRQFNCDASNKIWKFLTDPWTCA